MTIIWMQHPQHGKFPCTSADVELYRKAGWTEMENIGKQIVTVPEITGEALSEEAKKISGEDLEEQAELTRDQLLNLAEEAGVEVNPKWSTKHLRKILGL